VGLGAEKGGGIGTVNPGVNLWLYATLILLHITGSAAFPTAMRSVMKPISKKAAVAALLLSASALAPAGAADMSFERALNADREPQNWLLHHKNYQGHRFSQLNEINADTVGGLRLAFTLGLGGMQAGGARYTSGNLEATPLVDDGIMYIADGWGSVYAIDVTSGRKGVIRWKFDPGIDRAWAGDVACCGVNNRGVALWKDKVISVALDGRIFAIDRATGEMVWERKVAEPAIGETVTLAPLVVRDIAIIGSAGGEFGIRGWIDGTDLNTGQQAWRTYTIPGAGEPGNETWKDGKEHWRHGGGSVWVTATYDKDTDTIYQGVGNAGPDYDAEYRPGDNRWAASVLALDPATGKIKWGFQYTPNDPYDYDEISEHQIIDAVVNGESRKLVVHGARNGFYYALDRTNGAFVAGKQYVDELTWTTGLDPKTGLPLEYDPTKDVQTYVVGSTATRARPLAMRCPSTGGGKNWEPAAYNPQLNLLYIPASEGCSQLRNVQQVDFEDQGGPLKPRDRFTGGPPQTAATAAAAAGATRPTTGSVKALDPVTGEIKAIARTDLPNWSGVLATAGNIVFTGLQEGALVAYDGKTLKELWRFDTGCGIMAPPMSYAVNGKQYVAVAAGPHYQGLVRRPEIKFANPCSMVYVFAL
jgi:alcohol dehydrogenase (cytochrome c)